MGSGSGSRSPHRVGSHSLAKIFWASGAVAAEEVAAALRGHHEPSLGTRHVDGPGERAQDISVQGGPRALHPDVHETMRAPASVGILLFPARHLLVPVGVEPVVGEVGWGGVRAVPGKVAGEGPIFEIQPSAIIVGILVFVVVVVVVVVAIVIVIVTVIVIVIAMVIDISMVALLS